MFLKRSRGIWLCGILLVAVTMLIGTNLIGLAHAQGGQSYQYDFINMDINILPNSDLKITETQKFLYSSGDFQLGFRWIPTDKVEAIEQMELWEEGRQYKENPAVEVWIAKRERTGGPPGGDTKAFTTWKNNDRLCVDWSFLRTWGSQERTSKLEYTEISSIRESLKDQFNQYIKPRINIRNVFILLCFLVILPYLIGKSLFRDLRKRKIEKIGVETKATILRIQEKMTGVLKDEKAFYLTYEFTDQNGQKWTKEEVVLESMANRAKGWHSVSIYYLPDNPSESTIFKLDTESKVPCPKCGSEVVKGAIIEHGGIGDWCPNCRMSLQKMAYTKGGTESIESKETKFRDSQWVWWLRGGVLLILLWGAAWLFLNHFYSSDEIGLVDKAKAVYYVAQGNRYLEEGKYDEAISSYDEAITNNPRFANAYANRGYAYNKKGQYDQAITDCNRGLKINPDEPALYMNRGVAYLRKGLNEVAFADFDKAVELNPQDAAAYNNRAITYCIKGEYHKAWNDVHKAQDLGYKVAPEFIERLRKVSGREK